MFTTLVLLSVALAFALRHVRSQVPRLPRSERPVAVPLCVLRPVLEADEVALSRLETCIGALGAYPGPGVVVVPTLETEAPRFAADVGRERPVRPVLISEKDRRVERGSDKVHRLAQGEAVVRDFLGDHGADGIVVFTDDDLVIENPRLFVDVAAWLEAHGGALSFTYAPAGRSTWWRTIARINGRLNNQMYALADRALWRTQAPSTGWLVALRWRDFERMGGTSALAEYLADDMAWSEQLPKASIRCRLFEASGQVHLEERRVSTAGFWQQQLRWRAQLRSCRPWVVYTSLPAMVFALPVSVALSWLGATGSPWAAVALAAAVLNQKAAFELRWSEVWALPLEEAFRVVIQIAGLLARTIRWGDWEYTLDARARIVAKRWIGDESSAA